MLYIVFFVSLFVAAYGNAMRKRVYRRNTLIAAGKDAPQTSRFYDVAGTVLTTVGLVGIVAWFVAVTLGNPIAFFADR